VRGQLSPVDGAIELIDIDLDVHGPDYGDVDEGDQEDWRGSALRRFRHTHPRLTGQSVTLIVKNVVALAPPRRRTVEPKLLGHDQVMRSFGHALRAEQDGARSEPSGVTTGRWDLLRIKIRSNCW